MMSISIEDQIRMVAFWLCFTRVMIVFVHLPMMDEMPVPVMLKALISLIISYAFFPYVEPVIRSEISSIGYDNFGFLIIEHALVGLVMGYTMKLIMHIFIAAGGIIAQQIGFTSVSYFDPSFDVQVGPIEKIFQYSIMIMLVMSGGLIPMFKGMYGSFFSLNYMNMSNLNLSFEFVQQFLYSIITSAMLLASPILICNLLMNLVLGIMAKSVPQMNIMMVSFAVNIGLGLFILFALSSEFLDVSYKMYIQKLSDWFHMVV